MTQYFDRHQQEAPLNPHQELLVKYGVWTKPKVKPVRLKRTSAQSLELKDLARAKRYRKNSKRRVDNSFSVWNNPCLSGERKSSTIMLNRDGARSTFEDVDQ